MWIKVLDKIPKEGTMSAFQVKGKKLFITLTGGELFCAENRCPHEDIELTLGCLKKGSVVCSLHGFSFDLATGKSSDNDVDNMKTYPVKLENNEIYIQL
ncbi:Rieske 2Fe-2S domain-containing protein [Candidatus Thioglobus sp.]|jgi:nitrite reductase/ring-hydroxylating ferredoxin subunit|uniref:Rieske (2Fe-2S) protein n=1 Tax=Candidatus Thioglobus sp. TaxID=2026721 RepID=UPI001D3B4622|nr:Rieske 2Fe-2S domain-containing protein [Candidatus Thioglobus sp.]MBT3276410.1 Rieske 2Fe-2S domain-containing protein [Candidatus Thioglobus sp.]MBT3446456.1 Rieske 2Fe-2S domain-containing protein [Candidatus Thioglobus sp.]MBT4315866.1 Rieske 2Fe-2S domain-containing protein [Candidatus Thioglobus sp.]MBT4422321.1 Rieske 2Fe-2S domain-containing protein [Candidatus Thioglobus sp.]MBT6022438.1 Rieske 2Fe-2S domain-containing protein [Candidatus Thioglobus sp.]